MAIIAVRLVAVLLLLNALFGIGFGIYLFLAEAAVWSPFGLPVEVRGTEKALLASVCFLPALALGSVAWMIWRDSARKRGSAR